VQTIEQFQCLARAERIRIELAQTLQQRMRRRLEQR